MQGLQHIVGGRHLITPRFFIFLISIKFCQSTSTTRHDKKTNALYDNNNNQALAPIFWGRLWILNRLVKVGHIYCNALLVGDTPNVLCDNIKKKKKKKTLNNNYKEFHKAIKAYGTSPRSHSPLLKSRLKVCHKH